MAHIIQQHRMGGRRLATILCAVALLAGCLQGGGGSGSVTVSGGSGGSGGVGQPGGGGNGGGGGGGGGGLQPGANYVVLANNDLGMHCADQDYRIFSILPPFNVLHAQVVARSATPQLLSPADGVVVTYQATTSNIIDPNVIGAAPSTTTSVNSTSQNKLSPAVFKTNFWQIDTDPLGFSAYERLYPPGLLSSFPFEPDVGLPAPDLERLYLLDGVLSAEQAAMPGVDAPYIGNQPQPFRGYAENYPFFVGDFNLDWKPDFPFGFVAENFRRFTAEGIPILPIDDQGRGNPYPLMQIQARNTAGDLLAQVDTVVPVASEADCQGCHLEQEVCNSLALGIPCSDTAHYYNRGAVFITRANMDTANSTDPNFVPGETPEQIALNASKINILRLHDARHGTTLDGERTVSCARCHYSTALDLAQLGPSDDNGREQTRHVSMSRAMHAFHASLRTDRVNDPDGAFANLFPIMPPAGARGPAEQDQVLAETCYNCHPGKRTKCLRGAMGGAGIVCQDCHGQASQVGNDFSVVFPSRPGVADYGRRVPWADEPTCQSCHVGDAIQVRDLISFGTLSDAVFHVTDTSGNRDGLRLAQAYPMAEHVSGGGDDFLTLYDFTASRFGANLPLFRLSGGDDGSDKGHGGLSCEGCHGSTHAIWPNANPRANDNKTATDLQGHVGTIIECATCHEGDLGSTLDGPHGMHPVGGSSFANRHEGLAERERDNCRGCHGLGGEGTVLSRAATDRAFVVSECDGGTLCPGGGGNNVTVRLAKGQPVTCRMCHENKL